MCVSLHRGSLRASEEELIHWFIDLYCMCKWILDTVLAIMVVFLCVLFKKATVFIVDVDNTNEYVLFWGRITKPRGLADGVQTRKMSWLSNQYSIPQSNPTPHHPTPTDCRIDGALVLQEGRGQQWRLTAVVCDCCWRKLPQKCCRHPVADKR